MLLNNVKIKKYIFWNFFFVITECQLRFLNRENSVRLDFMDILPKLKLNSSDHIVENYAKVFKFKFQISGSLSPDRAKKRGSGQISLSL